MNPLAPLELKRQNRINYLDVFIPTARNNDGVLVVRRKPDARHPLSVTLLLNSVFTLGQSVPQLDGLVPRSGDNLPIISGKGHAQNIMIMVLKPASRTSSRQVPQAQILVPRSGQGKVSVGGQNDIGDKVSMAVETLVRDTVLLVVASQLPDDQGFVP